MFAWTFAFRVLGKDYDAAVMISGMLIPSQFNYIYKVYRSFSYRDLMNHEEKIQKFIDWLTSNFEIGIHGDPCNWKEHNLPEMEIYEEL